jgi:hypothetical protein
MRGYFIAREFDDFWHDYKMRQLELWFNIKEKKRIDSALMIQYHWRATIKRMHKK